MRKRDSGGKIALFAVGIVVIWGVAAAQNPSPSSRPNIAPTGAQQSEQTSEHVSVPEQPAVSDSQVAVPDDGLGNNNAYINVDGNTVHSPAYSTDSSVPAGAAAQCRDGTYSFSRHRSGTCSHHDGVAIWL